MYSNFRLLPSTQNCVGDPDLKRKISGIGCIGNLVGKRLLHMKNVALFKAAKHLPVEDQGQEAHVTEQAIIIASSFGLDTASVREFVSFQMKVAKAVQYRYRAQLLFFGRMPDAPKSLDNERERIAAIGEELLRLLATRLLCGIKIEGSDRQKFIAMLDAHDLTKAELGMFFDAVQRVILA